MSTRKLSLGQATAMYPHRFTMQHKPSWASLPFKDGLWPAPQYRTDQEWYDNTTFPGEGDIHGNSKWCHSSGQTWPIGQRLEAEFKP